MISDYMFDCGPRIGRVRLYSIKHLRVQNPLRQASSRELSEYLKSYNNKGRLLIALTVRLESFDQKSPDDIDLIEKLVLTGSGAGWAASPYHSFLLDVYWQAAALLIESYGCEHVNEIPR